MFRLVPILVIVSLAHAAGSQKEAGSPKKEPATPWKTLFDGKSLTGWKAANFGGEGDVVVKEGAIVMERGDPMTGFAFTGKDLPKIDYEIAFEGKKIVGNDFFCTTTFPVKDSHCSLVVGGWGGTVVGLSSLDGRDASDNESSTFKGFQHNKWYKVRIRVLQESIQAWIDDEKLVDIETKDRKVSIRVECDLCRPLGFATYRTAGAVKDVKVRLLSEDEKKGAAKK